MGSCLHACASKHVKQHRSSLRHGCITHTQTRTPTHPDQIPAHLYQKPAHPDPNTQTRTPGPAHPKSEFRTPELRDPYTRTQRPAHPGSETSTPKLRDPHQARRGPRAGTPPTTCRCRPFAPHNCWQAFVPLAGTSARHSKAKQINKILTGTQILT
jgi:hypothetical protein